MAKTFYEKYYKDQPAWAKGVINVVVVGGAAFVAWQLWKGLKRSKEVKDANQMAEAAKTELQILATRGIFPSYYDSQYESMATQLVHAMNGCGTDEEAVYEVFRKLRNDADVLKLVQIFGVRYYQPCSWSQPISYAMWLVDDKSFGGGIDDWLAYDLTSSEIAKVNQILRSNGISYQF